VAEEPWTKREDETSRAYDVFCVYLELGPRERSLQKVCEELGKKSGYVRHLERWSSEHDWVDRAAAWDEHMAEKRRQEYEKEMTSGLAHAGARVRKLKDLHDRLEDELEDNLWTEDVKIGPQGAQVRIKQYNTALVRDYLRSLKHIAKEVGGRKKQIDVSDTDDQVTFVLPENGREEGSSDD
jgi:hypothetical protein